MIEVSSLFFSNLINMPKIIYGNRFLPPKGFSGIALYPYIFIRANKVSLYLINHEKIHYFQQKELYIIGFYVWYILEYLLRLVQYRDLDKAYRNISFEREAYSNERDLSYLKKRSRFSFLKYIKVVG